MPMLWRRLDTPGHDSCRLQRTDGGWRLDGTAVFVHDDMPAQLQYYVKCDSAWHTQAGTVHGWVGAQAVSVTVEHISSSAWTLNGAAAPGLAGCVDLDFGFTPATNVLQLRRIALAVGAAADVPVAWLDLPAGTLDRLEQRYERHSERSYWYTAPRFAYAALLETSADDFVECYPQLWQREA